MKKVYLTMEQCLRIESVLGKDYMESFMDTENLLPYPHTIDTKTEKAIEKVLGKTIEELNINAVETAREIIIR